MTNICTFDCVFCVNRASSNVWRARFTADEIVSLTLEFYRRNFIEGLFLSSGILRSPDRTMEDMVRVAKSLRVDYAFRGYIHLKTIPHASLELIHEAGLYADRLSVNIEVSADHAFEKLAPGKDVREIRQAMAGIKGHIAEASEKALVTRRQKHFSPAGQSTQMIVGADASDDNTIMKRAETLNSSFKLKRAYYSAFSPIPDSSRLLPLVKPPLMREHRLYQADWLMRFYGYEVDEVASTMQAGMLDLDVDPKLAFALRNHHVFPVDVNRADREMLLRVPGLGMKSVNRILSARRHGSLRYNDLLKLGANMKNANSFLCASDWTPRNMTDSDQLRDRYVSPQQLSLF